MRFLTAFNNGLARVEGFVLSSCLLSMILLAFLQVIMRNVFNSGFGWADIILRSLVLWVGFLGAAVATKEGHHLCIDVATKFIPGKFNQLVGITIHIFATVVTFVLFHAAYRFVLQEASFGETTVFDLPAWTVQGIIPVTFALIGVHFTINTIFKIRELLQPSS
jgi:C4-dicarboxylate transporter, DctQ subunit